MAFLIVTVEFYGKNYKLQHPGAREWLKLRQSMYKISNDEVDLVPLLDYFFEHCCFPEVGEKLTIESFDGSRESLEELEDWGRLAPRFFRGELAEGTIWPEGREKRRGPGRPPKSESRVDVPDEGIRE